MKPITLKRAVKLAETALLQQRHVYVFDRNMFEAGIQTPHTENCKLKYDQLTQAINLLKSLIEPVIINQQSEIINHKSPLSGEK